MTLELNSIAVDCIIGELPDERGRVQRLSVDLKLAVPDDAAHTDLLEDTVDYAALAAKVRAALVAAKCRMIERAAFIAAEAAMEDEKVFAVEARVVKAGAVAGLDSAAATYVLRK